MPGIEPGAFHMQSERATTALHPLLDIILSNFFARKMDDFPEESIFLSSYFHNWTLESSFLFFLLVSSRVSLSQHSGHKALRGVQLVKKSP